MLAAHECVCELVRWIDRWLDMLDMNCFISNFHCIESVVIIVELINVYLREFDSDLSTWK